MNKKTVILIALVLTVCVLALMLTSCKDKEVKIEKIEVVSDGLKEFYALDEPIDYSKSKIKVYYTDGTSKIVVLTPEMITGFNSAVTAENASLKITFEDYSVNFNYNVTYDVPVQTAFRIQLVKKREEGRVVTVDVRATGLLKSGPVYAVKMIIQSTSDVKIDSVVLKQGGFTMTELWSGTTQVSLIIFTNDSVSAISEDSVIIEVTATRAQKTGTLYAQSISISDGSRDLALPPAKSLNIGETKS